MTSIKTNKILFSLVIFCSFLSYIYLEVNYNKLNENAILIKIEDNAKNILKKNENNFDQNSVIKFVAKKVIEAVIISSK
jgi:hypothetical protein